MIRGGAITAATLQSVGLLTLVEPLRGYADILVPVTSLRTILTLMLLAWLPLNCCCRLQAMFGMIDQEHAVHHLCSHDSSGGGCESHPEPHDHDHDCGCAGHDAFTVRTVPIVLDDLAIPSVVIDLTAVFDHAMSPSTPVVATAWCDEARLRVKAGSSLLRHHCALTV